MDYNPFGQRSLCELRATDVEALRSVAESWYVEYKSRMIPAEKIAKTISSFANTYGGYLVIGVEETKKGAPGASCFPGIPEEDVETARDVIRQAVAACIHPPLHYDCKVIPGEADTLLSQGSVLLVLRVPPSENTPHVHKSGTIFRRVNDGSQPVVEQGQVHELHARRERVNIENRRRLATRMQIPDDYTGRPYIRLTLVSDLWKKYSACLPDDSLRIEDIFMRPRGSISSLPFDEFHPTADGFIARQRRNRVAGAFDAIWEVQDDVVSDVLLPLRVSPPEGWTSMYTFLTRYEYGPAYVEALKRRYDAAPSVLDATAVFGALAGVLHIQQCLMTEAGLSGTFWLKAELVNLRGTTTFMDTQLLLDTIIAKGPPTCPRDAVEIPAGPADGKFIEITRASDTELEGVPSPLRDLPVVLRLFDALLPALGLPRWYAAAGYNYGTYAKSLIDAGKRAGSVSYERRAHD